MFTKPLLAETADSLDNIKYPVFVSPKLDGIRCLIKDNKAITRKFESIPNHFLRNTLEKICVNGLDGEIIYAGKKFNQIESLVMTEEGESPFFEYHVFDYVKTSTDVPFKKRYEDLKDFVYNNDSTDCRIRVVPQYLCNSKEEVLKYEQQFVDEEGYEGLMIRSLDGKYKSGRSTINEGILLKLKRFSDSEAIIIDIIAKKKNNNVLEKDNLGHAKRSKKKANLVDEESLGAFIVRDIKTGVQFKLGTGEGLTKELRNIIWRDKELYINKKYVKYKHQLAGALEGGKPRFPVWLGFRDERDM